MRLPTFAILVLSAAAVAVSVAQPRNPAADVPTLASLRGNWLGSIQMSPDVSIRQVIQIIDKADGSLGANFASVDQGALYVPDIAVELNGRRFILTAGTLGITIEGDVSADLTTIAARIRQGNASDPVIFRRVDALPFEDTIAARVAPADFPYVSEYVLFENVSDGNWLAGTLDRPRSGERVPAVVFLSGSGAVQRDYSTALAVADYLARCGFAVLRYDKRGVYQSTGLYAETDESALARDAAAAMRYLAERGDIDGTHLGFIGHSEGSQVIAQAVVDYGADPAFLVSMAGVGLSALETTILQDGAESSAAGATPEEVATLRAFSRRFYATAMAAGETEATRRERLRALYDNLVGPEKATIEQWYGPFRRANSTLNPSRASRDLFAASMRLGSPTVFWSEIDVPVLVLNGGEGYQVPAAEHVPTIMGVLLNPRSTSVIYPGLNHSFRPTEGDESISADVLDAIGNWVQSVINTGPTRSRF